MGNVTKDPRLDPIWRAKADAEATWRNRPERHDDRPDVGSGVDRKVWVRVGGRIFGRYALMPAEEAAEMSSSEAARMQSEKKISKSCLLIRLDIL